MELGLFLDLKIVAAAQPILDATLTVCLTPPSSGDTINILSFPSFSIICFFQKHGRNGSAGREAPICA